MRINLSNQWNRSVQNAAESIKKIIGHSLVWESSSAQVVFSFSVNAISSNVAHRVMS